MPDLDWVEKNHDDFGERRTSLQTPLAQVATCSTSPPSGTRCRRITAQTSHKEEELPPPPAQELPQHVHTCIHQVIIMAQVQAPIIDLTFTTEVYIYCVYSYTNIFVHTRIQSSISGNTESFSWHDGNPILMMDLTISTVLNIQSTVCILYS